MEDRKTKGAERHLLRSRQLSLQIRRTNKVWSGFIYGSV